MGRGTIHSTAEVRAFCIWLRAFWLRFWVWLCFGCGICEFGYDLVTTPVIWLRYGYALVLVTFWLRFRFVLDTGLLTRLIFVLCGYVLVTRLGAKQP